MAMTSNNYFDANSSAGARAGGQRFYSNRRIDQQAAANPVITIQSQLLQNGIS